MSFSLNSFKSALGVAARPNNFYLEFDFPSVVTGIVNKGTTNNVKYLCKATTIPSYTLGVVEIPHIGGRRMKVPGDRTYAEWSATFIADEAMSLHKDFEKWLNYIKATNYESDTLSSVTTGTGGVRDDYQKSIDVVHTGMDGEQKRVYRLVNAFPTELAQLDMSYDNFDTIAEYTVTFQYSHIRTGATTEGESLG